MKELSVPAFKEQIGKGCSVIDMRGPAEFASGFIPGSIFFSESIPIEIISEFLDRSVPLLIVGDSKTAGSKAKEFIGSGFDIAGVFCGKIDEWKAAGNLIDMIIDIDADELTMDLHFDKNLVVVDLRSAGEFRQAHVGKATSIPIAELTDVAQIATLDEDGSVYFYGVNDTDAMTAASWMKKHGLHNLRVIRGGWEAIKQEDGITIEETTPKRNSGSH